jgi:hypothetical protein
VPPSCRDFTAAPSQFLGSRHSNDIVPAHAAFSSAQAGTHGVRLAFASDWRRSPKKIEGDLKCVKHS